MPEDEAVVSTDDSERMVPFGRDLIEQVLREEELKFLVDSDGDFFVEFGADEETGHNLRFAIAATGAANDILEITCVNDVRIPPSDYGRLASACNTWNADKRWPKVYLLVDSPANAGRIAAEFQISLQSGCSKGLLRDTIELTLAASHQFWAWLHKEHGV